MVNELQTAFNEIADLRALPQDTVLEALQSALISAYRRDSGASSAQEVEARIDPATGRARIFVEKEVVEEADEYFSEHTEVTLVDARFFEPEVQVGDTAMVQVDHHTKKFGRIAAQTAKQVILQKIREAERTALYEEFFDKEGMLTSGRVQSMNNRVVTLRLNDRAEAILPRAQQIPGERYRQHEQLRVIILEVKKENKGPQIVVSRSHRNMLRRLLEYEVPEIYNGQVEIKSIAREAGARSKVAVAALQEGVDPVGACVGMRGIRIQNIVKELHNEKIDVIEWNDNAEQFIQKALSPARVTGVYLDDDPVSGRTAVVVVPDDQLSLAIGREGQNARLAAKLTGWRIDIKSVSDTVIGGLETLDMPPFSDLMLTHTELILDVQEIVTKLAEEKAVMPEEFRLLEKFAALIEGRMQDMRDEEHVEEIEQINAVRSTIPEAFFDVPVDLLEIDADIREAIESFGSVGDVMLIMLTDEERFANALADLGPGADEQVQMALDELMMLDMLDDDIVSDEPDATAPVVEEATETAEPAPDTTEVAAVEAEVAPVAEEAIVEPEPEPEPEPAPEPLMEVEPVVEEPVVEFDDEAEAIEEDEGLQVLEAFGDSVEIESEPEYTYAYDQFDDDEEFIDELTRPRKATQDKPRRRRQLVFDEESGEVVAKRRRKRSRRASSEEREDESS